MFYLMTFQTKDTSSHFQDMSKLLPKSYIVLINTSESVKNPLWNNSNIIEISFYKYS